MAGKHEHVYGLHAVRSVLERRPETFIAAKLLRDAGGKLAELERELRKHQVPIQHVHRAELDDKRHARGGEERDGCDAVVHEQEADDLGERSAPGDQHEDAGQDDGESGRRGSSRRRRIEVDERTSDGVREDGQRRDGEHRCGGVDQRFGLPSLARVAQYAAQQ